MIITSEMLLTTTNARIFQHRPKILRLSIEVLRNWIAGNKLFQREKTFSNDIWFKFDWISVSRHFCNGPKKSCVDVIIFLYYLISNAGVKNWRFTTRPLTPAGAASQSRMVKTVTTKSWANFTILYECCRPLTLWWILCLEKNVE